MVTLAILYNKFDLTTKSAKRTKLKDRKIIFLEAGFKPAPKSYPS